ncbi:hypothetical protein [Serratia sp. JSRIV004]|uniref:hypothetical protein n=1 Tax=Serratia sp. JSRIV004 TaxID=2831895 RepID=UPI001CC04916|nr:hypothetical protein [Serratia sp. JSRIV004]UAN59889.1 hypothetical protein KGP21_12905 [Serratia sp. JSRIV004]
MTAEIAVFNKSAVALAADSAVTISGGGTQKIYNGAEKLFALTKHHPVGLMVYGSGDLCSAPWELVIKAYRKQLGETCFDKLEEYSKDFFEFLEKSQNLVTDGMRSGHLYQYLSEGVFNNLVEKFSLTKNPQYWNSFSIQTFFADLEDYCNSLLESLSDTDFLDDFSGDDVDDATRFCEDVSLRIIIEKFADTPIEEIPSGLISVLTNVFAAMICKRSDVGNISGIVIAGYGNEDYYPKVLSYDVCGFYNGKIRKYINQEKCSGNGEGGVTPFAQDDEVTAFMQGCSQNLIQMLHGEYQGSIVNLLEGIDSVITEKVSTEHLDALRSAIVEIVENTVSDCDARIERFVHENYISKVVNMIKFLPKQDLAYMAESLVNLTAFKRKVSDDSETVGGPIDVAVISKADGFIWVKRKHYFDKEFNHHYFARS